MGCGDICVSFSFSTHKWDLFSEHIFTAKAQKTHDDLPWMNTTIAD